MGACCSKTPEPVHRVIAKRPAGYELRHYEQYVVAEVDMAAGEQGSSFSQLAGYIGVGKQPRNKGKDGHPEHISMTAPVVFSDQKVGLTLPLKQDKGTMEFIMPNNYKTKNELPQPTNSAVRLKDVSEQCVGVLRYRGRSNNQIQGSKVEQLKGMLKADKLLDHNKEQVDWTFNAYNPPWTPGFMRRNEIWINLHMSEEQVRKIMGIQIPTKITTQVQA